MPQTIPEVGLKRILILVCYAVLEQGCQVSENLELMARNEQATLKFSRQQVQVFNERGTEVLRGRCKKEFSLDSGYLYRCFGDDIQRLEISYRLDSKRGAVSLKSVEINNNKTLTFRCAATGRFELDCHVTPPRTDGRSGLISPFLSRIDGLGLPNASWIDEPSTNSGGIFRGMNPQKIDKANRPKLDDFEKLKAVDVDEVIVFKNFNQRTEKKFYDEIDGLRSIDIDVGTGELGEDLGDVAQYDFPYHGFEDFKTPCTYTVRALKKMINAVRNKRNLFLHCTVGEDRTGYLAGIYALLSDHNRSVRSAFEGELCENGYGAGNPRKPYKVVKNIRDDLTPVYLKMAYLVKSGKISFENLDERVCETDLERDEGFSGNSEFDAERYLCKTSTRFYP